MTSGEDRVTLWLLEQRLAGSTVPDDPTRVELPLDLARWPAEWREAMPDSLRPAAVLIPVIERGDELTLLLTLRSHELKHHAGQIAFPGGGLEEADDDVVAAALRETHEEIGIAPEHVNVLGCLGVMATVTGYAVTPIVGSIPADAQLSLDPVEVQEAFEVPLSFLLDERNVWRGEREFLGHRFPGVEYHFEDYRIWGATAHMITELRKLFLK
jgi:8-oxo-dGTP pyrophosphatase MutT (NUDIX family)